MGAHALVGVVAVIVVPVEDRRRRLRSKREGIHRDRAHDIDLAGAWAEFLAHHAHGQTGGAAEIVLEAAPALDGACVALVLFDPAIDCERPLGLSNDLFRLDVRGNATIGCDFLELGFDLGGIVGEAVCREDDLGKIDGDDGEPRSLKSFSLKRMVWKAPVRAPIEPMRACLRPRTTRQVLTNRSRSRRTRRRRRRRCGSSCR